MTLRLSVVMLGAMVVGACDSPGSGGRGGVIPVDAHGSDTRIDDRSDATTISPTDVTTADPDRDTRPPNDTIVPPTCATPELPGEVPGFTLTGSRQWSSPAGISFVGGPAPDMVVIEFGTTATGDFSLAGQIPDECDHCVTLVVDIGGGGTSYFANSGVMIVSANPTTALDVRFDGVTLTAFDHGRLDPGGPCFTIDSVRALGSADTCEPACAGRVCGDDGCGGECGPGCNVGQTCTAAGTCSGGQTGACTTITPTGMEFIQAGAFIAELDPSTLGASDRDYMVFEFFAPDTGTFNLANDPNDNYSSCTQCVSVYEDDNGATVQRIYYASKGSLQIGASSDVTGDPGSASLTFSNIELIEVTVESGTFISTPVAGGKCLKVANRTIATP